MMNNARVNWTRCQILLPKHHDSWFIWNSQLRSYLLCEPFILTFSCGLSETNANTTTNASIPNECPVCTQWESGYIKKKIQNIRCNFFFKNNRLIQCTTKSSRINQRTIFLRWAHSHLWVNNIKADVVIS